MKKLILPSVLCLSLLIFSCSNDSDNDVNPVDPPPNNNVTYTNAIKTIMDGNCTSCHGNPLTNGAPMPLLTFNNVKDAVQNRGLIGRVENGTMPPNGSLTSSQIQAIKDWQTGGLLE